MTFFSSFRKSSAVVLGVTVVVAWSFSYCCGLTSGAAVDNKVTGVTHEQVANALHALNLNPDKTYAHLLPKIGGAEAIRDPKAPVHRCLSLDGKRNPNLYQESLAQITYEFFNYEDIRGVYPGLQHNSTECRLRVGALVHSIEYLVNHGVECVHGLQADPEHYVATILALTSMCAITEEEEERCQNCVIPEDNHSKPSVVTHEQIRNAFHLVNLNPDKTYATLLPKIGGEEAIRDPKALVHKCLTIGTKYPNLYQEPLKKLVYDYLNDPKADFGHRFNLQNPAVLSVRVGAVVATIDSLVNYGVECVHGLTTDPEHYVSVRCGLTSRAVLTKQEREASRNGVPDDRK